MIATDPWKLKHTGADSSFNIADGDCLFDFAWVKWVLTDAMTGCWEVFKVGIYGNNPAAMTVIIGTGMSPGRQPLG